jgi:thioredoxin reductase (NADPH)
MDKNFDVIVIGGGPAGLTAGLYTSRDKLKSLVIEQGFFGGLISTAEWVENYPGFPDGISGMELGQKLYQQAAKFGIIALNAQVSGIEAGKPENIVKTSEGDFTARVVIIASGSERAKLNVPGEAELTGRGVSYCATCDAAFFRDVPVAVIGGGNSAISEAIHLAKFAKNVIVVHRRETLRATSILQDHAFSEPKLSFKWNSIVESIQGNNQVSYLNLKNVKTGETSMLEVSGVFVSTGLKPNTDFVRNIVTLDESGHIVTDDRMETSVRGIFAAGDCRHNSGMQSITAAGEGATAAMTAGRYISEIAGH